MANIVTDPGFENDNVAWLESQAGAGVADRNSTNQAHGGTHSGLTNTGGMSTVGDFARLTQDVSSAGKHMDDFNDVCGTLVIWHKNQSQAAAGPDVLWLEIEGKDNGVPKFLRYYWRLDGSALPMDTAFIKYIDMGTTMLSSWTMFSRNLYDDWNTKFGSPSSYLTEAISLYSFGNKVGGDRFGQEIYWDDVIIDPDVVVGIDGAYPTPAGPLCGVRM